MPASEILQFAGGGGANVLTQAEYAALASILSDGYTSGILDSNLLNKTLRQSNFMAVGLANFLVAQGLNVPDDGDTATLTTNIQTAINALITAAQQVPRGYLYGATLSRTGAAQVQFGIGAAVDSTNTYVMTLAAATTKTLQAAGAWAAGTGNNGLFTGARAGSTWYHCFLIRKTSDGTIDAGFDTSVIAANIPAGYAAYRRIGSVLVNSGNTDVIDFTQYGPDFFWKAPVQDVNVVNLGAASVSYTISTPPDVQTIADVGIYGGDAAASTSIYVRGLDATDQATGGDATTGIVTITNLVAVVETLSGFLAKIPTNTSRQIAARASNANSTFTVWTRGWRELF